LDLEDLENNENVPLTTSDNKPVQNKTISLNQLKISPEENVILILGSEGFGVSNDVMKSFVNYNIYIPPHLDNSKINQHPFDMIDSLNVGVSAGIIINQVCSEMKSKSASDSKAKSSLDENLSEIKSESNYDHNLNHNNNEVNKSQDRDDIKI
jgi:tRNA(Leu) C34 or U34 (ribose-2'-O)-methylase TrmL